MKEKINLLATALLLLITGPVGALPDGPGDLPSDVPEEEPAGGQVPGPFVLTSEDIENSGALVLGEILGRLPGLEVLDRGYLGAEKELSYRGFPPGRVLFVLDGEVINNPLDHSFDLNLIPVSAIERIEVTGDVHFQELDTHAAGGTVWITTKRYHGGNPFTRLTFANGSLKTNLVRGSFARGIFGERLGLSLSFNTITTNGLGNEGEHSTFQYHFQAGENVWKGLDVALSGAGTASSVTLAKDVTGTGDVELKTAFQHLSVGACIAPGGPLPLEISAYYNENSRDSLESAGSSGVLRAKGNRKGIRLRGLLRPAEDLRMTVGAEEEFLSGEGEADIFSLFSGVTWKNRLLPTLEAAGRWEREGSGRSTWGGGLRASRPVASSAELVVSYREASHLPALAGGATNGTRELGWERTIESGISCRLYGFENSFELFQRWSAMRVDDRDSGGEYRFSAGSNLKEVGWTVTTRVEAGEYLSVSAGYQNLDVLDFPSGEAEIPVPRHYFTGTARVQKSFKEGNLKCSYLASWVMARGRDNGGPTSPAGSRNYHVLDLNMGLKIVDVTIFYTIRNIFDHTYEIVGGRPMPGRVSRFGFTWDFFD